MIFVGDFGWNVMVEKELHDGQVAVGGGHVQRGGAVVVPELEVAPFRLDGQKVCQHTPFCFSPETKKRNLITSLLRKYCSKIYCLVTDPI